MKKKINFILILITCIIFLTLAFYIQKVPLFSDGAIHGGVIRYIIQNGEIPKNDFQGIIRNNLNTPVSINTPYTNLPFFYINGAIIGFFLKNNEFHSIIFLNIFPVLLSTFFFYFLINNFFNKKIAIISSLFFIFSNVWLWIVVHRLMEPLIILFIISLIYFFIKYLDNGKKNYLITCCILSTYLIGLKHSSYIILLTLFLIGLIRFKIKEIFKYLLIVIILSSPIIGSYIYFTNAISPIPINLPVINTIFNPWWEKNILEWEKNLNKKTNVEELRQKTLNQFKEVQKNPQNLIKEKKYFNLIQDFIPYPIIKKIHRGYQSPNTTIYPFFLLLFILFFIFIKDYLKFKNQKEFSIIIVLLIILVFLFWLKISVFRYYIYLPLLLVFIFGFVVFNLKNYLNKKTYIFFIFILVIILMTNLISETKRDLNYQFTVGHRYLPLPNGGLNETIDSSKFLSKNISKNENIFTSIQEISYYFDRKIIWDDRLFFIKNKNDLVCYLKKYNFTYLIIPFNSGKKNINEWNYYDGIPSDSLFNEELNKNNSTYFKKIKKYNGIEIYQFKMGKVKNCSSFFNN